MTILTHASDWEDTVRSYMEDNPNTCAINTTGDGCSDLSSTRIVNMLAYWKRLKPLMIQYNLVLVFFSQFWPEDSPSNKIERNWAYEAKKLINLTISDKAEGDDACPLKLTGVDEAVVFAKDQELFGNAMTQIKAAGRQTLGDWHSPQLHSCAYRE